MRAFVFTPIILCILLLPHLSVKENRVVSEIKLPVMVSFSKSIPDSIRDFVKVYMKLKKIRIISIEQAAEIFLDQEKEILLRNVPNEKDSKDQFLSRIETSRKPLYNILRTEMYTSKNEERLLIDSLKWYAIQPGLTDTSKNWNTFIPVDRFENCMVVWKSLVDTIIESGTLK
jgi:hypothetical protein